MNWDLFNPASWAPPIRFSSPLGATAWVVLAGIPVGIIALYFLKLRRRPVQVPSTLLWRRSLEDLHVNSLFQRLRRNLLLFLQLLAVLLAMLALAGPKLRGWSGQGQRYILLIDQSASMSATDVSTSRLDKAKDEATKIIDNMGRGDLAMVIAFSDRARVVSNYTGNRNLLRQRIASIEPTQGTTSLRDALQVASGLANPASDLVARNLPQGVIATQAMVPPRLMIYTDGGFPDVEGFSVGNLVPEVVVIGPPPPRYAPPKPGEAPQRDIPSDNLAILALQAARNEERPDQFQVFGRVHNYRANDVKALAKLIRRLPDTPSDPGTVIDAVELEVLAQGDQSFKFDLPDSGSAVALQVLLDVEDALPLDNSAFTVLGNPRRAQVLLVTSGNRYLAESLQTPATAELADVSIATPEEAGSGDLARDTQAGRFDLVIYDNTRPEAAPEANALYFGALPPGPRFTDNPRVVEYPVVLDWDLAHPLLQYVRDLGLVRIAKASVVEPPIGAATLIESNAGPIAFVAPRGGHVDAVIGFALLDDKKFNTDWPVHMSFPLFLYNVLRTLGNAREAGGDELHRPGQPVLVRANALTERIDVLGPTGKSQRLERAPQGGFVYNGADRAGLYEARWDAPGDTGAKEAQSFTVNLFDPRESDLAPRGLPPEGAPSGTLDDYKIKIGYTAVEGKGHSAPSETRWWPALAALMLGVLLVEWYVYNRRVYV